MSSYSDEYLEYRGERYCRLRLAEKGVAFEDYLQRPQAVEAQTMRTLLDSQQQVKAQLQETERLAKRNGVAVEPLHHHRHPNSDSQFRGRES